MKKIDIVVPCYNESENIRPLYEAIKEVFAKELPEYNFNLLCHPSSTTSISAEDSRGTADLASH